MDVGGWDGPRARSAMRWISVRRLWTVGRHKRHCWLHHQQPIPRVREQDVLWLGDAAHADEVAGPRQALLLWLLGGFRRPQPPNAACDCCCQVVRSDFAGCNVARSPPPPHTHIRSSRLCR